MNGHRPAQAISASVRTALLVGLLSACGVAPQSEPPGATPPDPATDDPTPRTPAPPATIATGPAGARVDLPGRIVAIAIRGVQNQAAAIKPSNGETTELWSTQNDANASDWTPSPDGGRVAYRVIQRSAADRAVEAVVVRALGPDAPATIVAAVDVPGNRLAGFGWAADGASLAVLVHTGIETAPGDAAGPTRASAAPAAWELRIVAVPTPPGDEPRRDDRVVWRAATDTAGEGELFLAAWDADAGRAAIVEVARDSGIAHAVRLVDVASGSVTARIDIMAPASHLVASPNGRWLAVPEPDADPPVVRRLALADGASTPLAPLPVAASPGRPVWSPPAAWIAWTEQGADGATRTHVVPVEPSAGARERWIGWSDVTTEPLAFAPGDAALLVGAADPSGAGWTRLYTTTLTDASPLTPLVWLPPPDTWAMSWVP